MSEVKRYDLVGDMDGNCNLNEARMELSADGVYVKHRDYEALQAKCAALAAENAAFKDINQWCKTDAFSNMYRDFKKAEAVGCCNIDCMHDAMVVAIMHAPEAPSTDAFMAEVRAQVVEMFADHLLCPDLDDTIRDFAEQLRKGGEQK
ncbi:hypothetical protein KGB50_gp37 [Shigella phage DS8]|uniref:Uncharacterized protein n=1 Tax=Shigella phage DS8 TaxID=2565502 RepID=A0A4P8MUE2_9CAUD|nr:hypothetical protein KGB50_gp37 [Shigella phage DS8]QCQ57320.1 hypothetical protein [Shigella phage DS8]